VSVETREGNTALLPGAGRRGLKPRRKSISGAVMSTENKCMWASEGASPWQTESRFGMGKHPCSM